MAKKDFKDLIKVIEKIQELENSLSDIKGKLINQLKELSEKYKDLQHGLIEFFFQIFFKKISFYV